MITPILKPFEGEHVVGLAPPPSARVTDWNRRLNLFTGRALSAAALVSEQEGRNGRLALRGQLLSPGVVLGLEAALDSQDGKTFLNVGPGYGISASGEDVFLARQARVEVAALPVYATAALLDGGPPPAPGALAARRLGPSLGELHAQSVPVPLAGIVVLEPVEVDQLANFDPADPCEEDPSSAAFADEQLLDGVRLVYYAWPDEWLLLPVPGAQWRNRLAYAIFDQEAANGSDQIMPWEQVGVPVALIGLDTAFVPQFVDRHSVVRAGGLAKRRTPLTPAAGHDYLWNARILQFAEQVTDFTEAGNDPATLPAQFRFIPPTGLLPTSAQTLLTGDQAKTTRIGPSKFFPGTFAVDAIPAPLEQLDAISAACAPLAEFDLFTPSQVTVVVPVPQPWFEPDLLNVLEIDPVFQQTVDQFDHIRSLWLKRRTDVRSTYSLLTQAATATPAQFPDPDPDAVETETVSNTQIDDQIDEFKTPELAYGTAVVNGVAAVSSVSDLKAKLNNLPGVKADLPQLDQLGLRRFADLLQTKADSANDHIDLGFLRIQTDIYRTRQKMLSEEAATRLAVSPALASIAQGVSAVATKDDLDAYLANAKITLNKPPGTAPVGDVAPGPPVAPPTAAPVVTAAPFQTQNAALTGGNVAFTRAKTGTTKEALQTATFTGASALFANVSPAVAAQSAATVGDVTSGRPIVGGGYDLRTTSVVLRLEDPRTNEVKGYTLASKYTAVSGFKKANVTFNGSSQSGMNVDDIEIPGFLDAQGNEIRKKFSDISDTTLNEILAGTHDRILQNNPSESDIFAGSVRSMENTIDILRLMEARVELYRQAAQLCRDTLATVNTNAASAAARLQVIANSLGESRHDVAFAKALMQEEQERIGAINTRRDQIILNQVRFLAYFRPRTVEARKDLPVRSIDPGIPAAVIPTCLARNLTAPDELRAYVNLLREAPLNWFRYVAPVINYFDRLDVLQNLIQNSKLRAGFKVSQTVPAPVLTAPGPLGTEIFRVFSGQQQLMTAARQATAQLDLTTFAGVSWAETRNRASAILSIGDIVDLGHYHPEAPRVSAAEIENILKVSACLYSDLTGVLPVLRLNWAERLTQAAGTLNLANLSALPRWGEVPALERKEMQAIVDWLFSRIDPSQPSAVSHINDLIRVAILLASHAPVADIIAGDVIRATTVTPGSRIDLSADLTRVRTGMHVLVYQANQPVARAVVEDLAPGAATARVLTMTGASLTLNQGTKVQFATPDAFDRNPLTAALL